MPHDIAARIEYSEKYQDDTFEYRCVARNTPHVVAAQWRV